MLTRRDFITRIKAAGIALPFAGNPYLFTDQSLNSVSELFKNDFFSVSFGAKNGFLEIIRSNGEKLLTRSITRILAADGYITNTPSAFRHSIKSVNLSDQLGEGIKLIINSTGKNIKLDLILSISLYKNHHAVFVEAECLNNLSKPIILKLIEPICATGETGGALHWNRTSKLLTNGPMYYDPGSVFDFSDPDNNAIQSWWNIGLFRGYDNEGFAIGAVENQTAQGKITVTRSVGDEIGLVAQSVLADGFKLNPGKSIRSNKFVFFIGENPYAALEGYADIMGKLNKARINSIVNGWCNWFFTYEHISEDEVIRNAEFASRVLKPYGLEYIQIDEGYQRWHGEWDGNDRFPHGMKWLAEHIRAFGLKPGLWIAPYVISEPTEIFQKHKDWLIKNPDGSIKRVGPWPDEDSDWARNENPKRYGLDVTHPAAAEWMFNLFDKISKQWGYQMIKIDFVDWSLLSAHHYYDPSVSRAMAYRKGFEIMRKAIGDECHLQDCGPGPITVGLIDSMRIELDQNYGYAGEVWKTYFTNTASSAPAAAKRYYFHKRTWINDADHLCMSLLSPSQAQAAATLLSLTGGNIISGDRLPDLDKVRLEILKKTLPSWGEAARPVDLFDTDLHRVFALKIRKQFGEWTIAGFFNSDENGLKEYTIPLNRLWLDNAKTYIGFDFWNNRYHGEFTNNLKVTIPPASVVLLSIHEKSGLPEVISSDRHILQGAVELEDAKWDQANQILSGISHGTPDSAYNLYIYIPDSHPWQQGGIALYNDFPGYTLKMTDRNILRMYLRFENESRKTWSIKFNEFFKAG